jgi:hypothetical protein
LRHNNATITSMFELKFRLTLLVAPVLLVISRVD